MLRKRRVITFTAIAIFALLGIIITQIFWIDDARKLREEQFNQRVKVALKSVSTQILDSQIDSTQKYLLSPCDTFPFGKRSVRENINANLLDSLLIFEFRCMDIGNNYLYGVFNKRDSNFIMGSYKDHKTEILQSNHKVVLSCLYKEDIYYLGVFFPDQGKMMFHKMVFLITLSIIFLIILSGSFYMITRLMFRQKRMSEVKSDFINNMTHEFKTPIATISIASEMLLNSDVNKYPYKTKRYANVIFDENARLQKQVEQILQLSVLEKGGIKLKPKEIDIHRLIRKQVKHFSINIQKKGGMITTELKAEDHHIMLDPTHISNIISNLIDNAVKYSRERPEVIIRTYNKHGEIFISISDNGIGISPENQKHIFRKLYRVPTGNLHDVKGFGLGLYYVKTIVEAHEGEIKLNSEINKGTTFILEFPLQNKPKIQ